jgi:hypothetical protein
VYHGKIILVRPVADISHNNVDFRAVRHDEGDLSKVTSKKHGNPGKEYVDLKQILKRPVYGSKIILVLYQYFILDN